MLAFLGQVLLTQVIQHSSLKAKLAVAHPANDMCFVGSTSLPDDAAPIVAGGLAVLLIVVALLATGNIGAGSIQLPGPPSLPEAFMHL